MKAIQKNAKTIESFDCSTNCPKRVAGRPCSYCYVEASRAIGYNAKKICSACTYNHEVLRFRREKIDKLNSVGGIRMFSFGDYMPQFDDMIESFLDDCLKVGLKVKVITKQTAFIDKFGLHPAINVINISVDNVGDGVPWDIAKEYREVFPKVRIRSAIMRDSDVEALAFSDVFTFNHASGLKKYDYKKYRKAEVQAWNEKLEGKVCCASGGCKNCSLKCAVETIQGNGKERYGNHQSL